MRLKKKRFCAQSPGMTLALVGLMLAALGAVAGLSTGEQARDRDGARSTEMTSDWSLSHSSPPPPAPEAATTASEAATGGVASAPCGDGSLTQSNSQNILANNTIQCSNNVTGVTADNGLARSFTLEAQTHVCGVTFGIQKNNGVGSWPVTVNLYEGNITGPFSSLTPRGSSTVVIPPNVTQQPFTAFFDPPVQFAAGEKMIVELFIETRVLTDGGDGGSTFLGSNSAGQTGPTFIRSSKCSIPDFVNLATIAPPTAPPVHLVMTVFTGTTGQASGACCIDGSGVACPGDITQNGAVDVFDLLALLACWGPVQPGCQLADMTGNGVVDVFDLLQLLASWGPCPPGSASSCEQKTIFECADAGGQFHGAGTSCAPGLCEDPLGACCLGGGVCQSITQAQCADAGGQFKGDFTSCASVICDLGPACPAGAVLEGEACGDEVNDGCPMTMPAYTPISCGQTVCGNAWASGGNRDTDWYTITVAEPVELTWTVDAPFPAQVAILNDQCGDDALEVIAVGEVDPENPSVTIASACVEPGTYRLFVAIDSFQNFPCGGGQNNYVATLSCDECEPIIPDGSTCATALPIEIGETVIGDTTGNDLFAEPSCTGFEPFAGVLWLKVVGDGTQLTAYNANVPGTIDLTVMHVYCGTCDVPACIGQSVSPPPGGVNAAWSWCSSPGETYYIAVWSWFAQEGNISTKVISSGQACEAEPCDVSGLCKDACGGQSPLGCFCDDACVFHGDCCPGICNDCPEVFVCVQDSCAGQCGGQAPGGCWCDELCAIEGDCCDDVCDECPDLDHCNGPAGSCAGLCGAGWPAGCIQDSSCVCWCDDFCVDLGDCCADICQDCPDLNMCQ